MPFTTHAGIRIYYEIEGNTIYFLGLVHERRHPDFLKEQLSDDRIGGV